MAFVNRGPRITGSLALLHGAREGDVRPGQADQFVRGADVLRRRFQPV